MKMREIMALMEAANKKKVLLKDGTVIEITVEQTDRYIEAHATINGQHVATAKFGKNNVPEWDTHDQDSWSSVNTYVDPEFQRKGIASALYDAVSKLVKIIPAGRYGGKQSDGGKSLWDSRAEWKQKKGYLAQRVYPSHWKPKKIKKISENIETNWYHGTDRDFDAFDNNFIGSMHGRSKSGFWFANSADMARYFGHDIYTVHLNLGKCKVYTEEEYEETGLGQAQLATLAKNEGYDSIMLKDIIDGDSFGTVVCVFDGNIIEEE
jgi:GNAT superfamily N-acetyltransferase